jgi:hypothetical protein
LVEPWVATPWEFGEDLRVKKLADMAKEPLNCAAIILRQAFQELLEFQEQAEVAKEVHGGLSGILADFAANQDQKSQIVEQEDWIVLENRRKVGAKAFEIPPIEPLPSLPTKQGFKENNASELKNQVFKDLLR